MSRHLLRRFPCTLLLATSLHIGCAGQSLQLMPSAGEGSNSQSGQSNSGQSNSQNPQSQSGDSSDGSSDSHAETSGTFTTGDKDGGKSGTNVGMYLLTGALLLTGTSAAFTWLGLRDKQVAYLRQHERDVRLALARGEGHFIEDVADNLALTPAEVPALVEALRRAQPTLTRHLGQGEVTTAAGEAFAEDLARAVESESRLAHRWAALRARAEALLVAPHAPAAPGS